MYCPCATHWNFELYFVNGSQIHVIGCKKKKKKKKKKG